MYKKDHKEAQILGITISGTSEDSVLNKIESKLAEKKQFLLITPYSEMMTLIQKDREFGDIVKKADILVPDAIGLAQAAKFLSLPNPNSKLARLFVLPIQGAWVGLATILNRSYLTDDFSLVRGRELFWRVLSFADKKGLKVFFFGSDDPTLGVRLIELLAKKYKKLRTQSAPAPRLDLAGEPVSALDAKMEKEAIQKINEFAPDLLILGITPPKQEKWFARNREQLRVGGALCLGATLDIATGRFKKAPEAVSHFGLEWLWRLVTGTKSLKRVWQAFPLFPLAVFKQKWEA